MIREIMTTEQLNSLSMDFAQIEYWERRIEALNLTMDRAIDYLEDVRRLTDEEKDVVMQDLYEVLYTV